MVLSVGLQWPSWIWFLVAIGQSLLIGLVVVPLSRFLPSERYRPLFNTWAFCSLFVLVLSPLRLVQPPASQLANLLQIILVIAFLGLLAISWRIRPGQKLLTSGAAIPAILLALGISTVVVYPWLTWGALGSLLDTALNLFAGLLFGAAVAMLLASYLLAPLQKSSKGIGHDLALAGLAVGTSLFVMTSAFGFNGLQLLLMLSIPALCIAVAGIGWYGQLNIFTPNWTAVAILIGIATAAPMLLVDPDELVLLLAFGPRDIPYWATAAFLSSALLAGASSVIVFSVRGRLSGAKPILPLAAFTVVALVAAALLFFGIGQPGLHGDQIFVIMADQANLEGLGSSVESSQKTELIYDRLVAHAEASQRDIRHDLDNLGFEYTPYYLVNALAVDGGPVLGWWLERRSDVDRVIENPVLRPLPSKAETSSGSRDAPSEPEWNLTQIGADRVWSDFDVTGEGIVIGLADSGAQGDHPELASSYRGQTTGDDRNWFDPWFGSDSPTDASGHGTHTLGIILGTNTGVAPGAQWIACANLVRGLGNPALYLDCLQFLLAPYPTGGDPFSDGDPSRSAHIINNSWLCPEVEGCNDSTLIEAASALREAGIFMVVSAGNEGPWCSSIRLPMAIFDDVFSVGAINEDGDIASFSSLGPVESDGSGRIKPDIVAPGEGVLSSFPTDSYEILSGTSMAGPHVAGVVALMWSANPSLVGDVEQTERILVESAANYEGYLPACVNGREVPNNGFGYGVLDAYEAVRGAVEQR